MNYALVKFFTEFSHRPMSEGNIFRVEKKDGKYILKDIYYANYEIRNGLMYTGYNVCLDYLPGTLEEGIWYETKIPITNQLGVEREKAITKILLFSLDSDADLNVLFELDGIKAIEKAVRRDN